MKDGVLLIVLTALMWGVLLGAVVMMSTVHVTVSVERIVPSDQTRKSEAGK